MRIGIIGSGFTGLAAAFDLVRSGHDVTLIDKDIRPGGLANGFKAPTWEWELEKHYHHLFTSDYIIRNLAQKIGHPIIFTRPVTSTLTPQGIFQLDSPASLLHFPILPLWDRLRTGIGIGYLKFSSYWKPLEKITAKQYILATMGKKSWEVIWKPLFVGKFGPHADTISAAWLWARIFKRSSSLGYPKGGFSALSDTLVLKISALGGHFVQNTSVKTIHSEKGKIKVVTANHRRFIFDKVICTLPTPLFINITPSLPRIYKKNLSVLTGIGAVNLILSLKKPFLPDSVYWLNINTPNTPFLAVVEHTNFISPDHYSGEHLLYIGNYLPKEHLYFSKTAEELLKEFLPHLQKINPKFSPNWVRHAYIWTAPFAQPIVTQNYSYSIPPIQTPIPNLYLANIQQVYPWDRGTNYAVELGQKVALLCQSR